MLTNKIFNASALATRLSSSAEPSQQICRLQSAHLLTIVTTPYCCTITHLIVVQLYTL